MEEFDFSEKNCFKVKSFKFLLLKISIVGKIDYVV